MGSYLCDKSLSNRHSPGAAGEGLLPESELPSGCLQAEAGGLEIEHVLLTWQQENGPSWVSASPSVRDGSNYQAGPKTLNDVMSTKAPVNRG